jgi:hypothetical protein
VTTSPGAKLSRSSVFVTVSGVSTCGDEIHDDELSARFGSTTRSGVSTNAVLTRSARARESMSAVTVNVTVPPTGRSISSSMSPVPLPVLLSA